MDITIADSWLRDFLVTKATPQEIAKYLTLCGPSIEKLEKVGNDYIYHIEITTNRIDSFGVYGIAREAVAILPRFSVPASLKKIKVESGEELAKSVDYLSAKVDFNLCSRFSAVLIKNIKLGESPVKVQNRLKQTGIRPINNVVDISNYLMIEFGQPVHTFDYDKITDQKMILRESRKDEEITTLDGSVHKLPGGDIVIVDGSGKIIDLAGIMGGENSAVSSSTKNVLLFVQSYDPVRIRKTSMTLAKRTIAATIFEKDPDPESVESVLRQGIKMFRNITGGVSVDKILDIYPKPYKPKTINVEKNFINDLIGVVISKKNIENYLNSLGFKSNWINENIKVEVPSFRSKDIEIKEDIVEEVARIFGYHNLPSILMSGDLPENTFAEVFNFENNIKNTLKGLGGIEIYTLSLVSKDETNEGSLKLINPLGADNQYLRTTLKNSLIKAAKNNLGLKKQFHIFEVANIYLPIKNNLPLEKMILAGVLYDYSYREAKGVIEALMEELNITIQITLDLPDSDKFIYYEFELESLRKASVAFRTYKQIPKYPPQIEDLTFTFPKETRIGDVISLITNRQSLITNVELKDIYKNNFTFRIWYQDPNKTLDDKEVGVIRKNIIKEVKEKFAGLLSS